MYRSGKKGVGVAPNLFGSTMAGDVAFASSFAQEEETNCISGGRDESSDLSGRKAKQSAAFDPPQKMLPFIIVVTIFIITFE